MEEPLVCGKCLHKSEPTTTMKNGHKLAYCGNCGAYIKNISYKPPLFYFGKYKGTLVTDCIDLPYLEWAQGQSLFKGTLKTIAERRIEFLRTGNIK